MGGAFCLSHITRDHLPPGKHDQADDWLKWFFKLSSAQRAVNVYIRLSGRANQRYALLFRDYLRAYPPIAQTYAQVKMGLGKYYSGGGWDDMEAYYEVKDPVCDIVIGGAEVWATASGGSISGRPPPEVVRTKKKPDLPTEVQYRAAFRQSRMSLTVKG